MRGTTFDICESSTMLGTTLDFYESRTMLGTALGKNAKCVSHSVNRTSCFSLENDGFFESGGEFCVIRIRVGSPATTTSCALRFGCRCHFSWRPQAHHEPHPTHPHPRWREEISENGQVYHGIVCFYSSPIGFPTFSDTGSCYKRLATSALLCTRCCSKGPHHAFAMFLNPRNTHNSNPPPLSPTASSNVTFETSRSRLDILQEHPKVDQPGVCRLLLTYPFTERRILLEDPPVRLPEISSESDPLASPLRHLVVLGLSPPSPSSSSSTLGDTSSSRSRTVLRPLPSPPQRNHLQHLLRPLVAQSRDSLLFPLGSFSTSEANSSTWATEKSGTSVSDELLLLDFFNLLLSRLSFRSRSRRRISDLEDGLFLRRSNWDVHNV